MHSDMIHRIMTHFLQDPLSITTGTVTFAKLIRIDQKESMFELVIIYDKNINKILQISFLKKSLFN